MDDQQQRVDGFRFLPPGLAAWIKTFIPEHGYEGKIPWKPLSKPVSDAVFALVTSAGISRLEDRPFDMAREKKEPTWGDPTFRTIPRGTGEQDIRVDHLHIDTSYIGRDLNVIFPLHRFAEFEKQGVVGKMADTHYSFYGFQWQNFDFLQQSIAPMADRMHEEGVEAAVLTPA